MSKMHSWRRWLEWPLTPAVFPQLLELPKGELRNRAIAVLRDRQNKTSVVAMYVGVTFLCVLGLFGLGAVLPHEFMTRYGNYVFAAVGVLYWVCVLGIAFGPALLKRKALRRELSRLIDSGELWTCANCNYRLQGSVTSRCPECGTPISPELQSVIRKHLEKQTAADVD